MDQIPFSGCFVCGPDNRCGLRAEFRTQPDGSVEGSFIPGLHHCGYQGIVHGGVLMSFLDETLGRLSFARDRLFLTHTLSVTFRKGARPLVPLRASAVLTRWDRRDFTAEGKVVDPEGAVLATATGRFLLMKEEIARDIMEGRRKDWTPND